MTVTLVPFLMTCDLVSFFYGVKVGFGSLQLKDLGVTVSVIGFGRGLFFLTSFLIEAPSMALAQFGARRWLARITSGWGMISACTAFVD